MKEISKDYKQLCYDLLYANKELHKKNKSLQEEIEILKRNKDNNVKDIIIQELMMYKRSKK